MFLTHREILGKRLREKRKELGLSQEAVGEVVGISRSAVSLFELGRRGMHTDVLKSYCEALELDANDLFGILSEEEKKGVEEIKKQLRDEMLKIIRCVPHECRML